jgi:hypothetical protein
VAGSLASAIDAPNEAEAAASPLLAGQHARRGAARSQQITAMRRRTARLHAAAGAAARAFAL